jgi:hypothetical protein
MTYETCIRLGLDGIDVRGDTIEFIKYAFGRGGAVVEEEHYPDLE